MRFVTVLIAVAVALSIANGSLYAQGRGNGQARKTAKAETRVVKAEPRVAKSAAKTQTRTAKAETKAARKSGATATTSTATTPTVITPTTPTTRSVKNPKLEARLLALLPPGATIQDASYGFKNWGQFVAATHVSNNLNIPFAELKARMTGIAPGTTVQNPPMSLGQAIQSFKPASPTNETGTWSPTKVRSEVKKAEDAANTDLRRHP
jgi:hypothetical protein